MSLPAWNGAASVYERLMTVADMLNRAEYAARLAAHQKKSRKPLKRLTPSSDADVVIKTLNEGDEETCKALLAKSYYVCGKWVTA